MGETSRTGDVIGGPGSRKNSKIKSPGWWPQTSLGQGSSSFCFFFFFLFFWGGGGLLRQKFLHINELFSNGEEPAARVPAFPRAKERARSGGMQVEGLGRGRSPLRRRFYCAWNPRTLNPPVALSSSGTEYHKIIRAGGATTKSAPFFPRAPPPRPDPRELRSLVHNMLVIYKAHWRPPCPPPRRKTGRVSSPFSGGKKPLDGLPNPESGRWIWWEREKIGARPSSFPPPDPSAIPSSAATAPPRRKRDRHREERRWRLLPQRKPPRARIRSDKCLTKRAVSSLESWLCSQADNTQTVCIPSRDSSFAGRRTQPVMRSALAKVLVLLHL